MNQVYQEFISNNQIRYMGNNQMTIACNNMTMIITEIN